MTIGTKRFSLARVTIEMTTGFRSSAFRERDGVDMAFVSDCNGLPTLSGTTIAGVLRHAYRDTPGADEDRWFGFTRRSKGSSSLVEVSGGLVHNQNNQPVPFLAASLPPDDVVLASLTEGRTRDHVRLNTHGVADDQAKFDELIVPAGARFTFELRVNEDPKGGADHTRAMKKLLSLLASPLTRLGGATHRGLGAFNVHQVLSRDFDLTKSADLKAYVSLSPDIARAVPQGCLAPTSVSELADSSILTATLKLTPDDFWSFGGGLALESFGPHKVTGAQAKTSQSVPVHEPIITWAGQQGTVKGDATNPQHYVPGSSVKGALRHRIEFHARRRLKIWLGEESHHASKLITFPSPGGTYAQPSLALAGAIKSARDQNLPESFAGAFGVDDVHKGVGSSERMKTMMHVAIDRFTQGPMDGFLFSETAFYKGPELTLQVFVNRQQLSRNADVLVKRNRQQSAVIVRIAVLALSDALTDLCEGRLALGARSARGLGYMTGKVVWSDKEEWLNSFRSSTEVA
jgi:CRISPR/Cas system CSM-associated protein Csm3 (group 7 of RAMP superfamily)